jgi:hypothetical protein
MNARVATIWTRANKNGYPDLLCVFSWHRFTYGLVSGILDRLPRLRLQDLVNRFSHLASQLSEGEAFSDKLGDCQIESVSIGNFVFLGCTIVVAKHLLI